MIDFDTINELLRYESETGRLFWKERDVKWFSDGYRKAQANRDTWNTRYANKEAFTAFSHGYKSGSVLGVNYLAHRLIWFFEFEEWPNKNIDHIDGNSSNNKIENLRLASQSLNMKNSCLRSDNESGCPGVSKIKSSGRWKSRLMHDGKEIHLGNFKRKREAVAARKKMEVEYGFHGNHGRPAK